MGRYTLTITQNGSRTNKQHPRGATPRGCLRQCRRGHNQTRRGRRLDAPKKLHFKHRTTSCRGGPPSRNAFDAKIRRGRRPRRPEKCYTSNTAPHSRRGGVPPPEMRLAPKSVGGGALDAPKNATLQAPRPTPVGEGFPLPFKCAQNVVGEPQPGKGVRAGRANTVRPYKTQKVAPYTVIPSERKNASRGISTEARSRGRGVSLAFSLRRRGTAVGGG